MKFAVCGATGQQGGAALEALLRHGAEVVALTRNDSSDKAKALAAKSGVSLAVADFDSPDSLVAAFQGVDGVFAVTDFWAACGCDPLKEKAQIINLVDAAKTAGIKHFVFSSLEDTRGTPGLKPLTAGYTVPHFDAKSEGEKYMFEQLGDAATALHTSIFYSNFAPGKGMDAQPSQQEPGTFNLFLPLADAKCAWCSTEDIGNVAGEVLIQGPEKWGGKVQGVCGDQLTLAEAAAIMTEVLGKKIVAVTPDADTWAQAVQSFGVPEVIALDLAQMCSFYIIQGMALDTVRAVESTKAVYPKAASFKRWVVEHKEELLSTVNQ
jgi:uncharacterized protein YbjT (DUF2867 family)